LEKVDPGTVLNFRQDKSIPYVVINRTDGPVDVAVESQEPDKKALKEGYEPVPKPEWLRIIPDHFHMEKGEVATADVILSVPNDPTLVGRHFQANIHAHTQGKTFLAVGILNTVRFSIGVIGPDSLKKEAALKTLENLDLDLTPQSVKAEGVPLGRSVALKDLKAGPLKITNRGAETIRLKLSAVTVDNTLKHPDFDAADPAWLTLKPATLKVKSNRIEEAAMFLNIPNVPENRGRKFMFVVRAELEGMGLPLEVNSRVYVTTEGDLRPQGEPVKKE
jgi:hypothetical protein